MRYSIKALFFIFFHTSFSAKLKRDKKIKKKRAGEMKMMDLPMPGLFGFFSGRPVTLCNDCFINLLSPFRRTAKGRWKCYSRYFNVYYLAFLMAFFFTISDANFPRKAIISELILFSKTLA